MQESDYDKILPYLKDAKDYSDEGFFDTYRYMRNVFLQMALNEEAFPLDQLMDRSLIMQLHEVDLFHQAYCDNLYMSVMAAKMRRDSDPALIEHDFEIIDHYIKPYKQDNWAYYDIRVAGYLSGQLQRIQGERSANCTNYFCNRLFGCGYNQIKKQKEQFFDEGKLKDKTFIERILKLVLFWRMESLKEKIKEIPAKTPDNKRSENRLQQIKDAYKIFKRECFDEVLDSAVTAIEASPIIFQPFMDKYDLTEIKRIARHEVVSVPEALIISLSMIASCEKYAPNLITRIIPTA